MKNSRKIYCVVLLLIIINTAVSQQYWLRQPSPTDKWLTKCTFVDSLYGWVVGDSGIVIHTSTGGISWIIQNSNAGPNYISDVFFLNRRLGWALANDFLQGGTIVIKTSNGGETWNSSRYPDSTRYLKSVYYVDSLTGYMGNFEGGILRTSNGGLNWNYCSIDSGSCYSYTMNKINFINAQTGYICGGVTDLVGQVWRTTNYGLNWKPYCTALEPLKDIKFNNGRIIATGGDYDYGSITVQSNNGSQWGYLSNGCFGIGQTLAFRTPSEVWVPLGFSRLWCVSNDSGLGSSWRSIPAPDTTEVYAAQFNSPTNGWAFGTGGAIYKYNTGIIGIGNNQNNVPESITLYQNYPNPFNPSTIITYELPEASNIRVVIYDITGSEIATIANGFIPAGIHEISFNAGSIASGVYIYKLIADGFTVTKKMLYVK